MLFNKVILSQQSSDQNNRVKPDHQTEGMLDQLAVLAADKYPCWLDCIMIFYVFFSILTQFKPLKNTGAVYYHYNVLFDYFQDPAGCKSITFSLSALLWWDR